MKHWFWLLLLFLACDSPNDINNVDLNYSVQTVTKLYDANGIGDYGDEWAATAKTGDSVLNKLLGVDTGSVEIIYAADSGLAQSYEFESTRLIPFICDIRGGLKAVVACEDGAEMRFLMILGSDTTVGDLITESGTVSFVDFLAPDGGDWTLSKFNQMQAVCLSVAAQPEVSALQKKLEYETCF